MKTSLKDLLTAQANKALSISYEEGANKAKLGGVEITLDQAHTLCKNNFGWLEYKLSPFEIIKKTDKFVKSIRAHLDREDLLDNGYVEFQNKPDSDYGKTFDRIVITAPNVKYTIIYGMKNAGGGYTLYTNGSANATAKFRTLKLLLEFLNTDLDY